MDKASWVDELKLDFVTHEQMEEYKDKKSYELLKERIRECMAIKGKDQLDNKMNISTILGFRQNAVRRVCLELSAAFSVRVTGESNHRSSSTFDMVEVGVGSSMKEWPDVITNITLERKE